MALTEKTAALAKQWLEWDYTPATHAEIKALVDAQDEKELAKRLHQRIDFGTAGLRGAMKAGFSNMNVLTVVQASQGLSVYVEKVVPDAKKRGVVIGYDGRHNSKSFAAHTAATFAHQGFHVYLFSELVPTPYVAYAVLLKKAAVGIMVTASHNPKDDNGYKVYWENGPQIIEPHDRGIKQCIEENLVPWKFAQGASAEAALKADYAPLVSDPLADVVATYYPLIADWSFHKADNAARQLAITYTAMHGVGAKPVSLAFEAFGLKPYVPVALQVLPDPDFPTVAFPNPEEGKGALKLAMETADAAKSPVIIANDPDADRLAAAEKLVDGTWKIFTGNELGILLAAWSWACYIQKNPTVDRSKVLVVNSTVSSKMIRALALKEGFEFQEALTGFKWLGNICCEAKKQGRIPLFAFEEAIGYMIGDACWDKDGVRAAAVFAEMASALYARGTTVVQELQRLQRELGYYPTNNRYFFCYDPTKLPIIFGEIRNNGKYADKCGRFGITSVRDLTAPGFDSSTPDKKPTLPVSSGTQMITFTFDNGAVATLRGSGTEPKLKYYVELPGKPGEENTKVEAELAELTEAIIQQFLQPTKFGLEKPRD
jgi:phosphomannomutase